MRILYICLHTCICTYVRAYTHTYMHTYIHSYIHTYIHAYIHTYIHTYIHMRVPTYVHTGTVPNIARIIACVYIPCIYICMQCVYDYICKVCSCIHTYSTVNHIGKISYVHKPHMISQSQTSMKLACSRRTLNSGLGFVQWPVLKPESSGVNLNFFRRKDSTCLKHKPYKACKPKTAEWLNL